METQTLSEDLLDGAAAAALFVFGDASKRRAIYRMTEQGLPVIRMGKRLFYRKSDLERAFQSAA